MKEKLNAIRQKIAQAKALPVLKAGKKAEIAEQVIDDCSLLMGEMIARIERLEGAK